MINFDDYANENKTEHNSKWLYIPDHPYRILIIGSSGSGKTNALLNLMKNQSDFSTLYIFVLIYMFVLVFIYLKCICMLKILSK